MNKKYVPPELNDDQKMILAFQQATIDDEPAQQAIADRLFMRFCSFKKAGFSKDWAMQLAMNYKGSV